MIDDLIKGLLSDHGQKWIGALTSKLGITTEQAERFVPIVLEKVGGLFAAGKLDLTNGLDAGAILGRLDADEIGSETGIDATKANDGLQDLIPRVVSAVTDKSGGVDGLLKQLGGGDLGGALGKLGKLF